MATVTCTSCRADNDEAEMFCLQCGSVLAAGPPPPAPDAPVAEREAPPDGELTRCPHCGADVPDPGNKACVECLRPFPTPDPPRSPSPPVDDPRVAGTRRDPVRGARLRLTFSAGGSDLGVVEVGADEELLVGREPASRCAGLFDAWDNVSRRHAVVGLEDDGAAWVRDEYSTNGTSLNDVPVRPGRRAVLQDGDRLGFGADVVAVVAREGAR